MGSGLNETRRLYERLWQEAIPAFDSGRLRIDRQLPAKTNDARRGVTLLLRPDPAVRQSIQVFLDQLRELAPDQFFYRPEEFHVTVLAVIPGSENWQDKMRLLDAGRIILSRVLKEHREFPIVFRGVTATAEAVLVQGFPADDGLWRIRNQLREELRRSPLGDDLDRRYRIQAAHLTIMRFCRPDADWQRLKQLLEANRTTAFGESRVQRLQLVLSDWYASANRVQLLEEYPLGN